MTFVFEITCILLGSAGLATGYFGAGLVLPAIAALLAGSLWLLAAWRRWEGIHSIGLVAFVIAAGFGVWIGLSPIYMATGILTSLLAWDLSDFSRRLRGAHPSDNLPQLERNHIIKIAALGLVALAFILATLLIHVQFTFEWSFILALVAIWGITQLANRLRRNG